MGMRFLSGVMKCPELIVVMVKQLYKYCTVHSKWNYMTCELYVNKAFIKNNV